MLRKILAPLAALATLTTASLAADLPSTKAPPVAPYVAAPVFTWTGFYAGGDIGGAWTNDGSRFLANPGFIPAYPRRRIRWLQHRV